MTKKYLLFAGEYYYPSGGFHDFKGSFDTIRDVLSNVWDYHDWYHIVDSETLEIIKDGSKDDDEIKALMSD